MSNIGLAHISDIVNRIQSIDIIMFSFRTPSNQRPGKDGFLSIVGCVIPKPEWQNVCPPIDCGDGYVTEDCTCTNELCSACPEGTLCNESAGVCTDCECGFCDDQGTNCCNL